MTEYKEAVERISGAVSGQAALIAQLKGAINENVTKTANSVSEQSTVIQQLKSAIGENVSKTSNEVSEQAALIAEIKTALEGKAGGGTVLPTLTNAGTASDLAQGKELIDASGNVVTGSLEVAPYETYFQVEGMGYDNDKKEIYTGFYPDRNLILEKDMSYGNIIPVDEGGFGTATPADVASGKTFTSGSGVKVSGTAQMGGGYAIKSGTTTSGTINTGLSNVEQFFMYKESQTGTGLIHLHYTKSATSRMYASAWSTNNYGTKTITNGTGGVTVGGGTITISATQATQGALTSGVTYKWIAVGTE